MSKSKTQQIELELNQLQAECLIQALRHYNLAEVRFAIKENLDLDNIDSTIVEVLDRLENDICGQIFWSAF